MQSNPPTQNPAPTQEVRETKKRKKKTESPPLQQSTVSQEPVKKRKPKGEYEKIKNKRGKLVSRARYEAALKRPLPAAFIQNARRAAKAKKSAVST